MRRRMSAFGAKRTLTNRCLPISMFYKAIIEDKKKLDLKPGNLFRPLFTPGTPFVRIRPSRT